jgi:hypothetical protein
MKNYRVIMRIEKKKKRNSRFFSCINFLFRLIYEIDIYEPCPPPLKNQTLSSIVVCVCIGLPKTPPKNNNNNTNRKSVQKFIKEKRCDDYDLFPIIIGPCRSFWLV